MTRLFVFCLLLVWVLPCAAGESVPFRFYKDVDRRDRQGEEILSVTLDSEVYAAARDGFPDLRVVDAQGVEAPYLLEKVTESRLGSVRRTCPSELVSLREKDDNSIEIRVRLDDDAPPADGLSFFTPLKNHERRVHVSGSNDGNNWAQLVTDGLVFDYSRYMDVSNHEVELPKNRYRRFKIVIDDVTDELESPLMELTRKSRDGQEHERIASTRVERRPFRIDRMELWRRVGKEHAKGDRKADYPIVEFRAEEDAKRKCTILHVRTRREPLSRFMLETASRNFSRRVAVQVPEKRGAHTSWVEAGKATLSVVRFRDFHHEQLTVDFPERRREDYRIVIENEDNPPLRITGVKAEGNVYRMVFLALADTAYHVYYGSESQQQPRYDTATVLSPLREGFAPADGHLGPQVANPDFGRRPGLAIRNLLGNRLLLGVVIGLMVVVLAWGLFRAGRRIDDISGPD